MAAKKDVMLELLLLTDEPMELFTISTEDQLVYFINDIERVVRQSREYRAWCYYMKAKQEQSSDVFTGYDSYEYNLTLEIHHVIFLYDIVYITGLSMLNKLTDTEDGYSTFQIADQVIRDHMAGIIPIVPMLKSYHEMYHEKLIEFEPKDIFGDYQKWLDKYSDVISEYKMKEFRSNLLLDVEELKISIV